MWVWPSHGSLPRFRAGPASAPAPAGSPSSHAQPSASHRRPRHRRRGEYAGAAGSQDQLAQIAATLPPAPDVHGDSPRSATPLLPGDVAQGFIGLGDAADWFSLSAHAGPLAVMVAVVGPWATCTRANLDVLLTLADAQGQALATSNPIAPGLPLAALPAALDAQLPLPGTYYLSVAGAGCGDPSAGGYSAYGSLGQYALVAQYAHASANASAAAPPPAGPKQQGPAPAAAAAAAAAPRLASLWAKPGRRMQLAIEDRSVGESSFQLQRCEGEAGGCSGFARVTVVFSTSGAATGQLYAAVDLVPTAGVYTYRAVACMGASACSGPSNELSAAALK